jgi:nicotinate-nucleotide pyrophosphorylase (carboxylating)
MDEVKEVLSLSGIRRIMLDNFSPEQCKEAVALIDGRLEIEASGGITPESILGYAQSGVNFISLGSLTHSVKSLDISFKTKVV